MILQYMFGGTQWVEARLRVLPMRWMGVGILLAAGTGLGAWIFGRPFLTSYFAYAELPVLGKIPVASALLFDIGVFALVVGATILILIALARQSLRGHRAAAPRPAEMPAVPEPVQSGPVPTAVGDD
ncbi:MnhB domain-containing protein [Azospirillum sp. INR13]|uniref:MnhB domain-containing protein n=1 Tax=Azospirillum sp. INR13 TaxID=2596919 RepID=UPI0021031CD9|nr:MnhB domain-containing protein [Azospirillum sp. INR13]